jgi:hypothetical protein
MPAAGSERRRSRPRLSLIAGLFPGGGSEGAGAAPREAADCVEVYVGYLRRKLDIAGAHNVLSTVRRRGYRLHAPRAAPPIRRSVTDTSRSKFGGA